MKRKALLLSLALSTAVFVGCAKQEPAEEPVQEPTQTEEPAKEEGADNVAAASVDVKDEDVFEASIGQQGTWIIATIEDLKFDKDLVLDGEFTNGKKDDAGKDVVQRKIALYTQDEDRNVTNRFTLTAPKLTIKSPNASIQHGTFVGDLYVEAENFELVDNKVEGNVYFANQKAKDTFKMDDKSSVTGKQELKK
jgi:hypothetical protein